MHISAKADAAVLLVDKRRVERIIANLLENASLYAGGATDVTVAITADDHGLEIAVNDAGPGIEADDRHRIFERFYRGVTSGRRGTTDGSGLGLALVAEHVRRLGGDVRIEAGREGVGSSFIVTLPLSQESSA